MKKESISPAVIERLQKKHPGMSKYIFSMTRKPDYYGIDLTQAARKLAGKKPKVEEHREKPCRLYVRLSTTDFRALSERLNGISKQDYIEALIKKALKEA
jgi:predicted DNA binding CopG/RHH family protein